MASNLTTDIRDFIVRWNNNFPIDLWWRKKYSVPFGSEQHRNMSFIDMKIEFEEDKMLKREVFKSIKGIDWEIEQELLSQNNLSEEELDREFEDLDINQFNQSND